jgi:CHAT domain-containing protein/Tfp pilus assembly protein PilF
MNSAEKFFRKTPSGLGFAILFTFLLWCSCSKDTAETHYQKGIDFFKTKKYEKAIKHFKKSIEPHSGFDRAYLMLARSYKNKGNLEEALAYFEELKTKDSTNAYADYGLGLIQFYQKDYEQAVIHFKKSIEFDTGSVEVYSSFCETSKLLNKLDMAEQYMANLMKSNPANARAHYGLGLVYQMQGKLEPGLQELDKSLELNPGLLQAYNIKSRIFFFSARYPEGIQVYKKGIEIAKEKQNLVYEGKFLGSMGGMYILLSKFDSALVMLEQAKQKSGEVAETIDEGRWEGNMGNIYFYLGQPFKAIEKYRIAAEIADKIGDKETELIWLGNIGGIYITVGEYSRAIEILEKTLEIVRGINDKRNEMNILGNIGNAYAYLGDYASALKHFKESLGITREVEDKVAQMKMIGNIGKASAETGEFATAFENYKQAIAIADEIGDQNTRTIYLQGIATLYTELGNDSTALNYHRQALDIAQTIGAMRLAGISLMDIGTVYRDKGEYAQAMHYYNNAWEIFKESSDKKNQSVVLDNIGLVYYRQDNYARALKFIRQAVDTSKKINYNLGSGHQLNNLGNIELAQKNYTTAGKYFQEALEVGDTLKVQEVMWRAYYGLALVFEAQENFQEALKHYKRAVKSIEDIRSKIPVEGYKSTFFQSKIEVYQGLTNLLFKLHIQDSGKAYDQEAFHYAERAKARSLLDILAESRVNIRGGIDPEMLKREREIFQKIARFQTELQTKKLTAIEKGEIQDSLKFAEEKLNDFQLELRQENPAYAELQYPQPLTISTVQENILHDGDILLEYSLGEINSYLWAITKSSSSIYQLPSQKNIEDLTSRFLSIAGAPPTAGTSPEDPGENLYKILLAPANREIQTGINLIVVPDGILHYLPFEALITGLHNNLPRYLIESHNISYAPSASVLEFIKNKYGAHNKPSQKELLAFANPDYGQPARLASLQTTVDPAGLTEKYNSVRGIYSEQGFEFLELPYTVKEVESIAALFPKQQTTAYLGIDAREETLKSESLGQYRRIHLATHALINEEQPGRSCIVLTLDDDPAEDGFLQMNEIFNLKIDADLVVLSACQTGRGKLVRGEGIMGLTRAFLYAGAHTLVVSHWPVSDYSTAEFMEKFYKYMQSGNTKSEALRKAKLDFLTSDEVPKYRHPYYWAPFVMVGNIN